MPKLCTWGNSLGFRLPTHIAEITGVKAGDELNVRVADSGVIEVTPARQRKSLKFARAPSTRVQQAAGDEW